MTTAQDIVDAITVRLESEGVPWQPSVFDGFKVGNPDAVVTGVAVTFQPTLDVLQRAAERGLNFVISHEAVFWEGYDAPQIMSSDPIKLAKQAFATGHDLVVWRIHDHLHRMHPEPVFTALLRRLGWSEASASSGPFDGFPIPEVRLDELATFLADRLETPNITVVGDPAMPVSRVGFGIHVLSTVLPALHSADVAIVGETPEYDVFEYARDAAALGQPKGVIRIAHERLEEWGMADFAEWLAPLVPGLRVEWVSTGDPFSVPR